MIDKTTGQKVIDKIKEEEKEAPVKVKIAIAVIVGIIIGAVGFWSVDFFLGFLNTKEVGHVELVNGTYKVGTDIPSGIYKLRNNSLDDGAVMRVYDSTDGIEQNKNILHIWLPSKKYDPDGAEEVKLNRGQWIKVEGSMYSH